MRPPLTPFYDRCKVPVDVVPSRKRGSLALPFFPFFTSGFSRPLGFLGWFLCKGAQRELLPLPFFRLGFSLPEAPQSPPSPLNPSLPFPPQPGTPPSPFSCLRGCRATQKPVSITQRQWQ